MNQNHSPWIAELNKNRKSHVPLIYPAYDVAIIGGGISGMVSAYYTLASTKHSVLLVDAGRIAHGATGHNAGQVVDSMEKPFSEIVAEYGFQMAVEGQKHIFGAWESLEEIIYQTGMSISFARFQWYAGCVNLAQVLSHLENKYLKHLGQIHTQHVLLAREHIDLTQILEKYHHLCEFVPHEEILKRLETTKKDYIAVLQSPKGVLNSALFVENLADYLLKTYSDRFHIREHALVAEVHLYDDRIMLETNQQSITSQAVVLCTNGFENINLINHGGHDINHHFHHSIEGVIGYMVGYLEKRQLPPKAVSYLEQKHNSHDDPYFYVTRRNHMWEEIQRSLVCIGGPEDVHEEVRNYSDKYPYSKAAFEEIDRFLKETYPGGTEETDYVFKWHGLMGYTESGIRSVGPNPANPRLLYNLGCNGVGILPSIYAGKKIARHIAGEKIEPTIFDPEVQAMIHKRRKTQAI